MADYCAPFAECTGLDSRLLINRTVYGPALAIELAQIPFGPVHLDGASLHSSVTWSYEQTWSAREACCAPVRSVFGLAPGETVTLEVRRREEVEVTDLVQSALESSEVRTRLQGERRPRPSDARTKDQLKDQMEKVREMQSIAAKSMSSPFLEFIVAAAVADEVADGVAESDDERKDKYAGQIAQMHEHENGSGAGTINGDTLASIDSILERVEVSESRNSFAETRTSEKTVTEQMLRRTFSNPYRDRTLELRFIPVFRRFEVRTRLVGSEPGIFFKPGRASFPVEGTRAKLANFVRDYVVDPRIARLGAADVGREDDAVAARRTSAVADYLNGAGVSTARLLQYFEDRGEQPSLLAPLARMLTERRPPNPTPRRQAAFVDAFAWSRARARSGGVSVPMAALENSLGVFRPDSRERLNNAFAKTVLDSAWLSRWVTARSVRIFMGTRVEAVGGTCVLPDLPTP